MTAATDAATLPEAPPTPAGCDPLRAFQWAPQPEADRLVRSIVDDFLARTPAAAELARRIREETATRFIDWVDHVVLPEDDPRRAELERVGYVAQSRPGAEWCYAHEGGIFPDVVVGAHGTDGKLEVAVRTESVADFAAANRLFLSTAEPPLSTYRRLIAAQGDGTVLSAVERHGYRGFFPQISDEAHRLVWLEYFEDFRTRHRAFPDDGQGFADAEDLLGDAIPDLGVDLACDLFFTAEREYWRRRNRAAQAQRFRQDKLGLGWANHDHHTYRSSRRHFARLIGVFERLGFVCRERFYAGREAGWGAQVLEQPAAGVVIFADVDLSPDEVQIDFAHEPLPERRELGTVGLWCALHGESFLQAGMHHLECRFDFDAFRQQMQAEHGVRVMKPFTDLPYLKQAFTEGERWQVEAERIERLLTAGQITTEQAGKFRAEGAIGSHLECLQRDQGFKGFNQSGVNEIITATDPRKHVSG